MGLQLLWRQQDLQPKPALKLLRLLQLHRELLAEHQWLRR